MTTDDLFSLVLTMIFSIFTQSNRDAAKKLFFSVARPLRGGREGGVPVKAGALKKKDFFCKLFLT